MASDLDIVVAGAGVVGLAVARALAQAGREVVVLEAEPAIGTATSARSSEVVHAGLYYPAGSRKASTCVRGRRRLYDYCRARGVAHAVCGKLVVATGAAQLPALRALQAQAAANGVEGVQWLDAEAVRALEPELRAVAALHSATTGIVDSHALMQALRHDAEAAGAMFVLGTPVRGGRAGGQGLQLEVGGPEPGTWSVRWLVNAAGHGAVALAAAIDGLARACLPQAHRCKGSYFALQGKAPFSRLVYPLPDHAGLGIHLTLDLAGQARFGPDTEWLSPGAPDDFDVRPERAAAFAAAVRSYWPGLPDGALEPAFAGLRPKIVGPGEVAADFVVEGPQQHGVPGLVNLLGIESPGLTAALALGEDVAAIVGG